MSADGAGPIHAFLAGRGRDGRGRLLAEVLAFDDRRLEAVHDVVQCCSPAGGEPGGARHPGPRSRAGGGDPRRPGGAGGPAGARDRMARFYAGTDHWLVAHDHNHLRITRILASLRDLVGPDEARAFHDAVTARNRAAGAPVNRDSLGFWERACG